jgi:hypothetical protein
VTVWQIQKWRANQKLCGHCDSAVAPPCPELPDQPAHKHNQTKARWVVHSTCIRAFTSRKRFGVPADAPTSTYQPSCCAPHHRMGCTENELIPAQQTKDQPMTNMLTTKPIPFRFETRAAAKERCAHKIQILRGGNVQEQLLAEKLARCRKDNPCNSGACDVCLGLYRLRLYRKSLPIFAARVPHPVLWTQV